MPEAPGQMPAIVSTSALKLVDAPGRNTGPALHSFSRPFRCLIGMTAGARIRDLILIGHFRRDERKGVAAHIDIRDRLLDFRHVTRHAIASRTSRAMMRVRLNARRMGPVWRRRAVTI